MADLVKEVIYKADFHILYFSIGRKVLAKQIISLLEHNNEAYTWVASEVDLYKCINSLDCSMRLCIWNRSGKILDLIACTEELRSRTINFVEVILNGFDEILSTSYQYSKHGTLIKNRACKVFFIGFDDISVKLDACLSSIIHNFLYLKIKLPFLPIAKTIDLRNRKNFSIKFMAEIGNLYSSKVDNTLNTFRALKISDYFTTPNLDFSDVFRSQQPLEEIYNCLGRSSFLNKSEDMQLLVDTDKKFIGLFKDVQRFNIAKLISQLGCNYDLIGNDFKLLGLDASPSTYGDYNNFQDCFHLDLGSHSLMSRYYQRPVEALYYGGIPLPMYLYSSKGLEINHPYNKINFFTSTFHLSYLDLLKNSKTSKILLHDLNEILSRVEKVEISLTGMYTCI